MATTTINFEAKTVQLSGSIFKDVDWFKVMSGTNTVTWPTYQPVVEKEIVTKIKPSEAIKLGRLMRPKVVAGRYDDGKDSACTMGAMALGYGLDIRGRKSPDDDILRLLQFNFPDMPKYVRYCIEQIPSLMDKQVLGMKYFFGNYVEFGPKKKYMVEVKYDNKPENLKSAEEVEASFIRALEAMGY